MKGVVEVLLLLALSKERLKDLGSYGSYLVHEAVK